MKTEPHRKATVKENKEPMRLLALSDGLFATVLTLLVLDLRIPEGLNTNDGNVSNIVKWLGPHLFGYLLTFLVAGIYWLAHHRNFDHIISYDRGLLGYNLLFLLFIGLLPFTTASISAGSSQPNNFRFFWTLYSANMAMAGIMSQLTWAYAISHHLVAADTTRQQHRYISMRQLAIPAVFFISILVEWIFPQTFLGPPILLAIPLVRWFVDLKYGVAEPMGSSVHPGRMEILWSVGRILPWFLIIGLAIWAMTL